MMVGKKDQLGMSLSLNLFPAQINTTPNPRLQLNHLTLYSSSSTPNSACNPHKPSWNEAAFTNSSADRNSETCRGGEAAGTGRFLVRGIDVNRLPPAVEEEEEEAGASSSPNSTVSSVSGKRSSERESGQERSGAMISDEDEDGETSRKKLRLSKDQSAILEDTFKEHNTLNPKQKLALAKQLGLTPRQVEVWFQNRRARTKLKQTEVDCEVLKRCCDNLTEENRRLQKEVQELRALKLSPQFYMRMTPPTTLTMCPSCERVAVPPDSAAARPNLPMAQAHPRPISISPWASATPIPHRPFDAFRL